MVIVEGEADLLEVVGALNVLRLRTGGLDRRQEEGDEDARTKDAADSQDR